MAKKVIKPVRKQLWLTEDQINFIVAAADSRLSELQNLMTTTTEPEAFSGLITEAGDVAKLRSTVTAE